MCVCVPALFNELSPLLPGRLMLETLGLWQASLGVYRSCPSITSRTTLVSPCDGHMTTLVSPCDGHMTTLVSPCDSHMTALVNPCDGHMTTLVNPCDGHMTTCVLSICALYSVSCSIHYIMQLAWAFLTL